MPTSGCVRTCWKSARLEGIVSMPSGVFRPYAGVSTAVLIFTKGGRTQHVWFYNMEKDGYSLDDKRNFIDGKGDIPDIIERYKKRREESPTDRKGKCFFMPYSEIKENGYDLSISKYREIEYEEVEYEKPEVILDKIEAIEDQIKANMAEMRRLLREN
jgi:type I restriction enzyme M protein